MEPHHEEPMATRARPEEKRKRFRIVKLEERITPRGHGPGGGCGNTYLSVGCYGSIE
jgi:hypothetical protein